MRRRPQISMAAALVVGEEAERRELQRQRIKLREVRLQTVLEKESRDRDHPRDRAEERAVASEPSVVERAV